MSNAKLDAAIARYIMLRDEKKALQDSIKPQLADINERLGKFEAVFLQMMQTYGLDSLPTANGTAYTSMQYSVKIEDWDAVLEFIRSTNSWYLLEKRLNKSTVQDFAESGEPVPGTTLSSFVNVNVRRGKS